MSLESKYSFSNFHFTDSDRRKSSFTLDVSARDSFDVDWLENVTDSLADIVNVDAKSLSIYISNNQGQVLHTEDNEDTGDNESRRGDDIINKLRRGESMPENGEDSDSDDSVNLDDNVIRLTVVADSNIINKFRQKFEIKASRQRGARSHWIAALLGVGFGFVVSAQFPSVRNSELIVHTSMLSGFISCLCYTLLS